MRAQVSHFLERPFTRNAIMGVILFNALILGLETSKSVMNAAGGLIILLDKICLSIFVAEIAAKLYARRVAFVKDGWNVFDFLIVGISLFPAGQGLAVLRALRILRLLRVVSVAPTMRRVVEGFLTALPGMGSVFLLTGVIFYIASVMATKLFSEAFPQWFGTLGESAYTLFQIMTLESWSMGIVRPVMGTHPYAWIFFVPFVIITSILVLNLVVAIVVDSMQSAKDMMAEEDRAERVAAGGLDDVTLESLQAEIRMLRDEIRQMKTSKAADE